MHGSARWAAPSESVFRSQTTADGCDQGSGVRDLGSIMRGLLRLTAVGFAFNPIQDPRLAIPTTAAFQTRAGGRLQQHSQSRYSRRKREKTLRGRWASRGTAPTLLRSGRQPTTSRSLLCHRPPACPHIFTNPPLSLLPPLCLLNDCLQPGGLIRKPLRDRRAGLEPPQHPAPGAGQLSDACQAPQGLHAASGGGNGSWQRPAPRSSRQAHGNEAQRAASAAQAACTPGVLAQGVAHGGRGCPCGLRHVCEAPHLWAAQQGGRT